jgi:hypothetical protein
MSLRMSSRKGRSYPMSTGIYHGMGGCQWSVAVGSISRTRAGVHHDYLEFGVWSQSVWREVSCGQRCSPVFQSLRRAHYELTDEQV